MIDVSGKLYTKENGLVKQKVVKVRVSQIGLLYYKQSFALALDLSSLGKIE